MKSDTDGIIKFFWLMMASCAAILFLEYLTLAQFHFTLKDNIILLLLLNITKNYFLPGQKFRIVFVLLLITAGLFLQRTHVKFKNTQKRSVWINVTALIIYAAATICLLCIQDFSPKTVRFLYPVAFFTCSLSSAVVSRLFFPNRNISDQFEIKIEKKRIENKNSFNWKLNTGYLNITSPQQGIFLQGGSGSGKTYCIILEILNQAIQKGYTGFIYDFKFPELTNATHKFFIENDVRNRKLWIINFKDPHISHRINPINPKYILTSLHANEVAEVIMKNINPEWAKKTDFWGNTAIATFRAVIWFLRRNKPKYCTLPHAIALCLGNLEQLMLLLQQDKECARMTAFFYSALEKDAIDQIAGMQSSLQQSLQKLVSQEIFWILSADTEGISLDINDPLNPAFLCIGSDSEIQDSVSPIISLIASITIKRINQDNRLKCLFLLDEAPTLFIPNFKQLPNTGRSRGIATVYACQSRSQMVSMYGEKEAEDILGSLANQITGMVNSTKSADDVVKMFGRKEKVVQSISSSKSYSDYARESGSSGTSLTLQEKELVKISDLMTLKAGEFVGKIAEGNKPFFKGKVQINRSQDEYPVQDFVVFPSANFTKKHKKRYAILKENMRKYMDKGNIIGDSKRFKKMREESCKIEELKKTDTQKILTENYERIFNEADNLLNELTFTRT